MARSSSAKFLSAKTRTHPARQVHPQVIQVTFAVAAMELAERDPGNRRNTYLSLPKNRHIHPLEVR